MVQGSTKGLKVTTTNSQLIAKYKIYYTYTKIYMLTICLKFVISFDGKFCMEKGNEKCSCCSH